MIHLLKAISEANNHLLKENNINDSLQECISALGSNILVDRCYIFKNEVKGGVLILNYEFEWCKEGVQPFIGSPELSGLPYDVFPGLFETLNQNLPLYGLVSKSDNVLFRETMEMQGILSYLFIPIFSEDQFWGWIGFDDCESERLWQEEEVNVLHTVARNIGIRLNQDKVLSILETTLDELNFYMKSSNQAKWEWNLKTHQITYSYNWMEIFGYTIEELGNSLEVWREKVHPEDYDQIRNQLFNYIFKKTDRYDGVARILHKNGHYIWTKYSGILLLDSQGTPSKIIGTQIDISAIKEKEIELAQQRNDYDNMVNNLAEIVFKTDLNGQLLFLNKHWEKITGYNVPECIGQNIFNFLAHIDPESFHQNLNQSKVLEGKLINNKGKKISVLLLLSLQIDYKDNSQFILGSITDINDLISLRKELEISEEKYRFIAENTSDLVVQHQFNGIVKYISNNCGRITGYSAEELLDKDPYQFIHPDDIQEIVTKHNNILNLRNEVITFRFLKKNQEYVWFETSVKIIRDSADYVIGIQTSSRDITQRLKYQEEVKLALEKQSELNDLKSGFVTMASHQFRTPLSVIYSNIELLNLKVNQSINKKEIKTITSRITSEVDRMTELMNNILLFGENESNKLKIDLKKIAFSEFIERIIETYYQNEKDGRKLIVSTIGTEQKIETDERLLIHILTNLISNAFKYSKGCQNPELLITYLDHNYTIEIIDYGIGILPEENKHLFKSFFRGSNTSNIKGSGLGLIVAKQFTELLKGTINIQSIPFNTRVVLEFPYLQK
jgi:PAS domain S-box-containing protein